MINEPSYNFHTTHSKLERLPLWRNFSWTFAGNILNVTSQFGILFVLAHLGDAEAVGVYGLALAITAPIFLFMNMSLRDVQVTDVRHDYEFSEYLLLRSVSLFAGLVITWGIVWMSEYPRDVKLIVLAMGVSKSIDGLSDIMYGLFQKEEQMDKIARSMMAKAILTFICFTSVFWMTKSILLGITCMIVIALIRLVTYDLASSIRLLTGVERRGIGADRLVLTLRSVQQHYGRLKCLLLLSLPVGVSSSVISLNSNVPRYVVERFEGPVVLGIFTVLAYPLLAGNTVISALSQSSLPRLAQLHANRDSSSFVRLLRNLLAFSFILALVAFILAAGAGETLLRFGFGKEYSAYHPVFLVLVIAMGLGFISWFLNTALHAMRAFKTILIIHLITLATVVTTSLMFIPHHGVYGAAWIVTASMALQVIVKAIVVGFRSRGLANLRTAESGGNLGE